LPFVYILGIKHLDKILQCSSANTPLMGKAQEVQHAFHIQNDSVVILIVIFNARGLHKDLIFLGQTEK
jgi:hypothetical protein